jgi:proline iminopeptidase
MSGYEHSDPFDEGMLAVSSIHRLHYEQYGRPDGKRGTIIPLKPTI